MNWSYLLVTTVAYLLWLLGHFTAYYMTLRDVRLYGAQGVEKNRFHRREFEEGTHRRGFVRDCIVVGVMVYCYSGMVVIGFGYPLVLEIAMIVIAWGNVFYDLVLVPIFGEIIYWWQTRKLKQKAMRVLAKMEEHQKLMEQGGVRDV